MMIVDSTVPVAEFHCSQTSPTPVADCPRLELLAIYFEGGRHYAACRIGSASRMLPLDREHLENFATFERLLKANGIAARHPRTTWREAIRQAFARGGAA